MSKQSLLNFPIRKTRSSTKSHGTCIDKLSTNELVQGNQIQKSLLKLKKNYISLNQVEDQENRFKYSPNPNGGKILATSPTKKRDSETSELEEENFLLRSPNKKTVSGISEDVENTHFKTSKSCAHLSLQENEAIAAISKSSPVNFINPLRTPLRNLCISSNNNVNNKTPDNKFNVYNSPIKEFEELSASSPMRRSPRKLNFNRANLISPFKKDRLQTISLNKSSKSLKSSLNEKDGNEISELEDKKTVFGSPNKKIISESSQHDNDEDTPLKISKNCARLTLLENNIPATRSKLSPIRIVKVAKTPKKCINNATPDKHSIKKASPTKVVEELSVSSGVRRSPRKLNFNQSTNDLLSPIKKDRLQELSQNKAIKDYQSLKSSFARNFSGRLIGRDEQLKHLESYLGEHLLNCIPGSLYISGAPGTGKTASVTKIVDELQIIKLKTVFLNCMTMKTSKEIFSQIGQSFCKNCGRKEKDIIANIEKYITSSKTPILIILDEIDQLESNNQKVLYTLFEWPSLVNSKLVLVGIANMLDLTDRVLPRLQANQTCRPQLLHFSSYSKMEIINIINERIKEAEIGNSEIIAPSAIQFLAGKIAAVAGDARKALDVCRRAVEICEIETRKKYNSLPTSQGCLSSPLKIEPMKINIPQVLSIFNEIYGSRITSEIVDHPNTFPLQQKVLICSLILILKNSKTKDINLGKFHEVYSRVCNRQNLPSVEQSEFYSICSLLESRGMLHVKKSRELRSSKVLLRLNQEEAEQALGDRVLLANILDDTSCLTRTLHN